MDDRARVVRARSHDGKDCRKPGILSRSAPLDVAPALLESPIESQAAVSRRPEITYVAVHRDESVDGVGQEQRVLQMGTRNTRGEYVGEASIRDVEPRTISARRLV